MAAPISSDLTTMRIPNWIAAALVGGNLLISLWLRLPLTAITLNFSCGAAVLLLATALFSLGWIGGGDAKLAAATAVWIGWRSILDYGLAASIFGGLLTALILVSRALPLPPALAAQPWISRLHDRRSGIPYGVALGAAGLLLYPHTQIWAGSI